MLMKFLVVALASLHEPSVDTAAVYSVLLQDVRAHHPGLPVVLAETRSGVDCMPLCGATYQGAPLAREGEHGRDPPESHSAALLRDLRSRGLAEATCVVPERTFGCRDHPGHLFVGLSEIREKPPHGPSPVDGGWWVRVAVLVPCRENCGSRQANEPQFPDGYGYWTLLRRGADGAWRLVGRQPAFFL
jgi:hypothetical protein